MKALAIVYPRRWIPCYITNGTRDERTGEKRDKTTVLHILNRSVPTGLTLAEAAASTNDTIKSVMLAAGGPDAPWRMQDFAWWLIKNYQPAGR